MRRVNFLPPILLAFVAGLIIGPASASSVKPCLLLGTDTKVEKVSVQTCKKFYSSGSAIKFPVDSKTVKYGVVVSGESGSSLKATFFDRNNKQTIFAQSLIPKTLVDKKQAVQYIFQAKLRSQKIVSIKPVLFVPTKTMLLPFVNSQFIGQVNNLTPVDGINETDWIRWNFNQVDSNGKLQGKFVNLKSAVRVSQMMEPPAPCEPALIALEGESQWYSKILGNDENIFMYWDPGMHTRMNSEYVVSMGGGITYMSTAPSVNVLMKTKIKIQNVDSWTIHGNPMGTPYLFDAGLGFGFATGFSAQTPVISCVVN